MKVILILAVASMAAASPGGYIAKGGVRDFKRPLDYMNQVKNPSKSSKIHFNPFSRIIFFRLSTLENSPGTTDSRLSLNNPRRIVESDRLVSANPGLNSYFHAGFLG